ncbi:hypothetical protein [Nocardioides sp. YIM 152315]|uniref:hypothetical protein n=1 Tax=Nocardioides sp. YIM 152315 TaxID=3031760 RepID=UPI0023DB0DE4|nr:hypothetical protein [Nocardioides sp. YIM 152315]MDF1603417.1 hypothetical protein [Nocardioides sp. YIM 152315]
MTDPSIRDFQSFDTLTGALSVTLTGCQVGDWLVVFVSEDYEPDNISAPAAVTGVGTWTEGTKTPNFTSTGCGVRTFWAQVTAAGDKTITATTTNGDFGNLAAYCAKDCSGVTAQVVNASATYSQSLVSGSIPAADTNGGLAVSEWAYFDNAPEGTAGVTMPAGWTEDADHGNGGYGAMAYAHRPVAAGVALGTQTATAPNSSGARVSVSTVLLAGTSGGGEESHSGGSTVTATATASGDGRKQSSGGGDVTAVASASGGGSKVVGGGSVVPAAATATGGGRALHGDGSTVTATATAAGAGHPVHIGGSAVTGTASSTGAGHKRASGGSAAAATVTTSGGGHAVTQGRGGSTATATAGASGGGRKVITAGAPALAVSDVTGSGVKVGHGGSPATATATATGAGHAVIPGRGGSTAHATATATGAGYAVRFGGGSITVVASGTGDGTTLRRGGSTAAATATATGGGGNPEHQRDLTVTAALEPPRLAATLAGARHAVTLNPPRLTARLETP